jgi:cytochrome c oxidase subunit 2
VYADPPSVFRRWLARESKPASGTLPQAFDANGCSSCHTIRGTSAHGDVGPDLTHVGSRTTLAALAIPNDAAHLAQWIRDAQSFKPGAEMPPLNVSPARLNTLVMYLRSLK